MDKREDTKMTGSEFNRNFLLRRKVVFASDMGDHLEQLPRITCRDGFSVSIQASAYHYCTPRNSRGPWGEVECGFPSDPVPEWREWRDGDTADTSNVFGYVPIDAVLIVLEKHGGIVDPPPREEAP